MWKAFLVRVVMVGVAILASSSLQAAVLVINPTADTFVTKTASNADATYANRGASAMLGGSIYTGNRGEYSLLRFDLSGTLPGGATINAATLKISSAFLYNYSFSETLRVYQGTSGNAGWVEGTGGNLGATGRYENQTSYTNHSTHAGSAWASGGIFDAAAGDLGTEIGTLSLGTGVTVDQTLSISLSTAAVTAWLSDSNLEDSGIVFRITNSEGPSPAVSRFFYAHSMNSGKAAGLLPQIEIAYTPIPEPSAAVLLGLGAALLLARRRFRRAQA